MNVWSTIRTTPASDAAATSFSAWPTQPAMGFSISTCFPAAIAASPRGACVLTGVAIATASMSERLQQEIDVLDALDSGIRRERLGQSLRILVANGNQPGLRAIDEIAN